MAGKSGKKTEKKRAGAAAGSAQTPADSFRNEVILWIVLAFSIILFISNFGIAGKLGDIISGLFFGLFGLVAYLFPVLLFAGTAFVIANRNNKIAAVKFIASAVFFWFICFFLELIGGDSLAKTPFDSYIWGTTHKYGGGFFGGLLTWLIQPNLGTISAYVIDIAVMIICIVLITERSLWKPIESGSRKMYASAKYETVRQRKQRAARKEERRQRRMDNKVVGVSTDTSIKKPVRQENSDAIGELRPEPVFTQDFPIHMSNEPQARPQQPEAVQEAPAYRELPKERQPEPVSFREPEPVIPVTSQKVALQPSMPKAQEKPHQEVIDAADDILSKTSDLFSELLPDIETPKTDMQPAIEDTKAAEPDMPVMTETPQAGMTETPFSEPDVLQAFSEDGLEHTFSEDVYAEDAFETEDIDALDPFAAESLKQPEPAAQPVKQPVQPQREEAKEPPQSVNQKKEPVNIAESAKMVDNQVRQTPPPVKREYVFPPVELLKPQDPGQTGDSRQHLQETALKLQQTLKNFGVNVTILNVSCGPAVTRYEIQPEMGVKVSKIVNLADDIKLNLAAADIRIEAPIPGKAAIGIEVPNKENVTVMFRELIEAESFRQHKSSCAFAVGKDIAGKVVVTDICKMPHLLIAGATGSGKSVCINTIIMSIIYKANPEDVKLIMIDPKVVELSVYNGIPHLLLPVVTDPKKAAGSLHWAVSEMMERYQKFASYGVRDIKGYNAKIKQIEHIDEADKPQKMPYIVIIVDELADLMMVSPGEVEDAICRLAQLARACGIHLIIATQRPSVNVITGLIKANMPSRIAFSVTSGIDSRTILDMNGAEKLLGKGDMLFYPQGYQKPIRVQGAFISDPEVSKVVEFLSERNGIAQYNPDIEEKMANAANAAGAVAIDASPADERDTYFADAAKLLIDKDKASVSMLQRYFKIGFNRAARIMDQLEEAGVVGPEEGTKPRKILMSPDEFAQYQDEYL